MILFKIKGDEVVFLGDTEENNNDGFYPDRVEVFNNGRGWGVKASIVKTMGLVKALSNERGLRCGGIDFCHEEEDHFSSAEECLIDTFDAFNALKYNLGMDITSLSEGLYIA